MGTIRKGSLETLKFKKWKMITLRGVAGNTKAWENGKWAHLEGSLETLKIQELENNHTQRGRWKH